MKIGHNAEVRKKVTEEGGMEPVLFLARTEDTELHKEVLPALTTLSFADANKVEIAKNGGLPPLVAMLKNPERQVRVGGAGVVLLGDRSVATWLCGALMDSLDPSALSCLTLSSP